MLPVLLAFAIPFEFQNNQIYLRVGINQAKPAWFVLDSGASSCVVDKEVARKLKLRTSGSAQGTGAGKGTYEVKFAEGVVYRLPGLELPVARSYVIDLSGQTTLLGRPIAGILGSEFFEKHTVGIDFETSILTLDDPHPAGEAIPFKLVKRTPYLPIQLKTGQDPVEVEVLVDSGSGDAVDAEPMGAAAKRVEIVGGVGLGQEFRTTVGRAEWVRLGSFQLDAPLGSPGGKPLIGNEILRRFDVTFDYAGLRLFLKPNVFFGQPFAMDASGLDLRWTSDLRRFAVHDVARDTPASEAGLKAGDEIATIEGQPAAAFRIDQVQRLLTRDGRIVKLGIGPRTVELRLRKRL